MSLHRLAYQIALQLPEVTCTQPFGPDCDVFKVMDKVFMLSFHLESQAAINLKVIPDDGAMLRDIYPYIRAGWHMNKQHWITVYEDEHLDATLVQDLIRNSYDLVVSKLNKIQQKRIALLKSAI
ncbi:MmcQ/YjbR family DNA-binding protein [Acinetobacter sp. SA01]|uniref:MmcQ/YjbR family DNA-binding protein n=1 Tax=Acinetobacter sp. SA01 TaxID=1862567 RepID=UPI00140D6B88|nr:MmcQ/YjbR family DNA-binding protein [Acinetobacter sp. SA01]